jgi:hypothetical protein
MTNDDALHKLLNMDPLLEAEKLTGKSYKEDADTSGIGMLLHMQKGDAVRREMEERDDTHYSTPFADTLRIYLEEGFVPIFERTYKDSRWDRDETTDYKVLWRNGVIAAIESYGGGDRVPTTNTNSIYGNWHPNEGLESRWDFTSSGHFSRHGEGYDEYETEEERAADPWVWVGHWDMRTGLRHTLNRLDNNGKWLTEWVDDPWLWLHSYTEERDDNGKLDLDALTAQKVAEFPEDIKNMINRVKAEKEAKRKKN